MDAFTIKAMRHPFQTLEARLVRPSALFHGLAFAPLEDNHELAVTQHFVDLAHTVQTAQVKDVIIVLVLPEHPEVGGFSHVAGNSRIERPVLVTEQHPSRFNLLAADGSGENRALLV